MSQESLISEILPPYQIHRACAPNVLVVGETGVGKSSVINLIAGEQLAAVSASAMGCALEFTSYDIVLDDNQGLGQHIRLFDIVGLDEPSMGKNDYLTAIEKANVLITNLRRTGGIRLLVFCIRGSRITSVTQTNYFLFRDILCQNKIPVAFVITGLENELQLEGWWKRNAALFEKGNLSCDMHVCVTATRGLNNVYERQYTESQRAIRCMLLEHMSKSSWTPEFTWWFVQLAGKLSSWVGRIRQNKRQPRGRQKDLTAEELTWRLEEKCRFTRKEAKVLADKILANRKEDSGSSFMNVGGCSYLSDDV